LHNNKAPGATSWDRPHEEEIGTRGIPVHLLTTVERFRNREMERELETERARDINREGVPG